MSAQRKTSRMAFIMIDNEYTIEKPLLSIYTQDLNTTNR